MNERVPRAVVRRRQCEDAGGALLRSSSGREPRKEASSKPWSTAFPCSASVIRCASPCVSWPVGGARRSFGGVVSSTEGPPGGMMLRSRERGTFGRERLILSLHYVHRPVPVCPCTYNRCAVPRLCEGRLARGDGIAYSGRHGDGRPEFVRFQRARLVGQYVRLGRRLRTLSVRYI